MTVKPSYRYIDGVSGKYEDYRQSKRSIFFILTPIVIYNYISTLKKTHKLCLVIWEKNSRFLEYIDRKKEKKRWRWVGGIL
ncbi:hypothetical protein GDO78_013233 [Eleutherodactylus coqui]|uniref:Uncharacterized protein n=1 Tax=Eleutherodactylus coqui TaxID=57060 RepID=A0A8J6K457_ELECQ|nr:hypothetical protein GDO78_013233 [Eleutherodactylus coqui]